MRVDFASGCHVKWTFSHHMEVGRLLAFHITFHLLLPCPRHRVSPLNKRFSYVHKKKLSTLSYLMRLLFHLRHGTLQLDVYHLNSLFLKICQHDREMHVPKLCLKMLRWKSEPCPILPKLYEVFPPCNFLKMALSHGICCNHFRFPVNSAWRGYFQTDAWGNSLF